MSVPMYNDLIPILLYILLVLAISTLMHYGLIHILLAVIPYTMA